MPSGSKLQLLNAEPPFDIAVQNMHACVYMWDVPNYTVHQNHMSLALEGQRIDFLTLLDTMT